MCVLLCFGSDGNPMDFIDGKEWSYTHGHGCFFQESWVKEFISLVKIVMGLSSQKLEVGVLQEASDF